jgi:hypothetical protein
MIRAGDTMERMNHVRPKRGAEGIGMRTLIVTLLTAILGLFVGYVLFELAAIFLSEHTAEAGVGRILIRLTFVCGGIALIVCTATRTKMSIAPSKLMQRSKP